jgi:hypothetical protein
MTVTARAEVATKVGSLHGTMNKANKLQPMKVKPQKKTKSLQE